MTACNDSGCSRRANPCVSARAAPAGQAECAPFVCLSNVCERGIAGNIDLARRAAGGGAAGTALARRLYVPQSVQA